jgi:hypothetical protein
MEELISLSSDELIVMYHKVNAELTKQFLNRTSWNEQQERIKQLSEISKELIRREVEVNKRNTSAGDILAS